MLTFPLYSWFYISYFIFSFLCLKGIYLPLFYFECYNSYCLTPCYLKDIIKIKWKYKNNELILISNEMSICTKSAPVVDMPTSSFWNYLPILIYSSKISTPFSRLACYYICPPLHITIRSSRSRSANRLLEQINNLVGNKFKVPKLH